MSTRRCYVLMPFAAEFDKVYESIQDVAKENGFNCERADKKRDIGLITSSIVLDIIIADIVIADISGFNPNVMYELGFAHILNKPTILLSQELGRGERLPFDISHMVTIPYQLPRVGYDIGDEFRSLRENLNRYINARVQHSNPIYSVIQSNKIKLFRGDLEWLWGLESVFRESQKASEVWIISNFLFWEQLSPLFNRMIEERTIAGKRKTCLMLPDRPELCDSSAIYLDRLSGIYPNVDNYMRILHVPSEEMFSFLVTEICIYDPFTPDARGVLLEPMTSVIGEDQADVDIEKNIASGASTAICNLKESTFDIELSKHIVRKLSSVYKRIWNKYAAEQNKPDSWTL